MQILKHHEYYREFSLLQKKIQFWEKKSVHRFKYLAFSLDMPKSNLYGRMRQPFTFYFIKFIHLVHSQYWRVYVGLFHFPADNFFCVSGNHDIPSIKQKHYLIKQNIFILFNVNIKIIQVFKKLQKYLIHFILEKINRYFSYLLKLFWIHL